MGRLQTAKTHYKNLRERVYEVLEVAAPGDVFSRVLNLGIILLVVLNVLAFGLSLLDRMQPYQLYLDRFELISVAFFSVEYLLRLWSCPASPQYAHPLFGRLRFVLRPMMLVDLVAVLPFYLPFFIALDLRLLRLLRLARLVRLFKLARYLEQPPADETAVTDLLNEYQRAMAQQRAQLNTLRDENMIQHREQVDQAIADIRRAQQLWQVRRRRGTGDGNERQAIEAPIETLAASIAEELWLENVQGRNEAIYQQAAALFDEAPLSATLGVEIGWKNIRSFTRVPARRIGQYHFGDLNELAEGAFVRFRHSYTEETKRRLDAVRAAISYALDQGDKEGSGNLSQEVRVGLNRATNRLRDLGDPMRAAWDGLIWELQNEQQNRIERTQTDIGRYGSLMFYFGRLVRWVNHRVRYSRERLIDVFYELLPQVRATAEETYRRVVDEISPALLWLGLTRARAREVLETVDQAQMTPRQDLAEDYRKHFTFAPLEKDNLFVGFDEELALIDQAIQRWENGRASSFIMYGQRGSGKTTLINIAEDRLFDEDQPVTRAVIRDKIATVDALVTYLAELLELPEASDFEGLARDLLAGPRRAVLLEGCHNLFLRKIGGLEAVRYLLWLVARTNHNVLWGLCLGKYAHDYLSKFLPLDQLFHFEIAISAWKPHELRQLILLRHDQSGYSHSYAFDKDLEKALRRRVRHWRRPEEPAAQEALEQIFFEELAETCGENILVALYYWLRALDPNGRDHYTVKPMRELDLDMVNNSTLEQAFILAAILHHDNLNPQETAEILDANLIQTRLQLDILDNLNILDIDAETRRYRVNPVVLQPVSEMLEGRNLLY
jgi:hypothetical protein